MQGIGQGCQQAGAALIGGETAEMPGIYHETDYDLAGFTVGIVEKSQLLDGSKVQVGDAVVGIASSGVHANGFSLVRKILDLQQQDLNAPFAGSTLGETLLSPTRIYVKPMLQLLKQVDVHAIAHITGGGLIENIPRVLPEYTQAHLQINTWPRPEIFSWLQEAGQISDVEMYRTFNCGIGLVVCLPQALVATTLALLEQAGETAWLIGQIESSSEPQPKVSLS